MDFSFLNSNYRCLSLSGLLCACLLWSNAVSAAQVTPAEIKALEKRFRAISTEVYSDLVRQNRFAKNSFKTIEALEQETLNLASQDKHVQAIYLIRKHLNLIKNNIDNRSIFYLIEVLLAHNEWNTANEILATVRSEGDKSLLSNVTFVYAKYFINRKEWSKALENLDGVINDLPTEDANYALLLQGIADQNLKKHRTAVKYYSRISETSKYHSLAVLNTAVAYIRQGWWTDAKLIIDKLLENPKAKVSDEMVNRLYLVSGYSLLEQGYYRHARDAFRNISLDSQYTNRALLGIALTATNQEDFIGALNAINILKQKKSQDLSVDESHLLLPYIYEKLKQHMTASKGYTEALGFYQVRIKSINSLMTPELGLSQEIRISANKSKLHLGDNIINFTRQFPKSFLENHSALESLRQHVDDNMKKNTRQKFERFYAAHTLMLKRMTRSLLDTRIGFLNSYMSQSRFGLARLYDNSVVNNK